MKKVTAQEALNKYFKVTTERAEFPITCECGFVAEKFVGTVVHLRKVHQVYIERK